MWGHHMVWVGLVLVGLLLPTAVGQAPALEPVVEVSDAQVPGLVEPLGEPGLATVEVRVGCEPAEPPGTVTVARLGHEGAPGWASIVIAPSRLSWTSQPGDCPGGLASREAEVSVALDQTAPAYEPVTFGLTADVEKVWPEEARNESYGRGQANVTVTPGYFGLYNLRLDSKIAQARADETVTFEPVIENHSNHETAFTVSVVPEVAAGLQVAVPDEPVVVGVNETGSFQVHVDLTDPGSGVVNEVSAVQVEVTSASTHDRADRGERSELSMLVQFRRSPGEAAGVPGPGVVAAVLAVLGAGLRRRR